MLQCINTAINASVRIGTFDDEVVQLRCGFSGRYDLVSRRLLALRINAEGCRRKGIALERVGRFHNPVRSWKGEKSLQESTNPATASCLLLPHISSYERWQLKPPWTPDAGPSITPRWMPLNAG
jgi:hypothetical protein